MENIPNPSALSTWVFVVLVAWCLGWAGWGLWLATTRGRRPLALGALLGWLGLTAGLAAAGLLERFTPPPPILFLLLSMTGAAVWFARSPAGGRLVDAAPAWALIGVQGFRLPLELVLASWNEQGALPTAMTFRGVNFDIVTGVTALVGAALVWRGVGARWVPVVFNGIGLSALAVIIVTALGSLPTPFAWVDTDVPLVLPARFPYVWLPMVCVGFAHVTHLLSLRQWWRHRA